MHKTRQEISRLWPIARKGTKYVIVPSHSHTSGIPLLIIVRDMLKIVKTQKELKKVLLEDGILVNGKPVREENTALVLFDTLSLKDEKKNYRLIYSKNRKFDLKEISEKEVSYKICKVTSKKMLSGKKVQINFSGGRNLLSKESVNTGDSVLINMKEKKIEKVIPIKEKSKILVIKGKHLGSSGVISEIDGDRILVKSEEKDFEIKNEELIVIE